MGGTINLEKIEKSFVNVLKINYERMSDVDKNVNKTKVIN